MLMVTLAVGRWPKTTYTRTKISLLAGLFVAFLSVFFVFQTASAASPPTYTLNAGIRITAKGGFLSDPSGSPVFVKNGSTWQYAASDASDAEDYYNASAQEVYFNYSRSQGVYITRVTQFVNTQGVQSGQDLCYVAISVPSAGTSNASFTGVNARTGSVTNGCRDAVRRLAGTNVTFNTPRVSGEQFMGITIEVCSQTPGSADYALCTQRRQQQVNRANNAISCTTTSAQGVKNCENNKAIIQCLRGSANRSVAYCKSRLNAIAVIEGDVSSINANMTDEDIQKLCGTLSSADNRKKCIDAATEKRNSLSGSADVDSTTSCALDGVGWIVCPVAKFIAEINDAVFSFIQGRLQVSPSMFAVEGRNVSTYETWGAVRNIANVAFIISFMIIVYSQLTGVGLSNYGIKKMLPRLAIAAILVNTSFWICAIAVDLSNIIGAGLYDLLGIQLSKASAGDSNSLSGWGDVTAWLLSGGTLAAGGIAAGLTLGAYGFFGALALLLPLAVAALFAFLTVIFVLVAREAFIIILVVLAPLAFVAYLLPNTESWFDKWRKFFFSLLLMYPLIALLFGGSQLAAAIIRAGTDDALTYVLSLVVQVVPLFALPLIMKLGGSVLSRIGAMVNNPNRGPFDRLKKGGARYAEQQKNYRTDKSLSRTRSIREGNGGALGRSFSKRRRAAAWVTGIGGANAVDAEQRDTYSKAVSESAKRDYVAEQALAPNNDYAVRVGGSEEAAKYVKAYAIQAKADELEKDIKASQLLYKDQGRSMSKDAYMSHLQEQIHSENTEMFEKRAAMREFGSVANADAVNKMADKVAEYGERQDISREERADFQREFVSTFKGDGRMPINFSSTNAAEAQTGDFVKKAPERIVDTIDGGKLSAGHFGKMDIDEMREWNEQFTLNPALLSHVSAEKIDAVRKSIQSAETDPRINRDFGDREYKALAEMKQHLAKSSQDAAAATYGPNI